MKGGNSMEEYIEQIVDNADEYNPTEEENTTIYIMKYTGKDIDDVIDKYKDGSIILRPEYLSHIENRDNPHKITKKHIGLGNVNNTSDKNKPISAKTQEALDAKADKSNQNGGFTGGISAKAENEFGEDINAIQLGSGTNSAPRTLQVYDKRIVEEDGSLTDVGDVSCLMSSSKTIVSAVNELIELLTKKADIDKIASVPIGTIIYNASKTPPKGYLKCDGKEVSRADYIELYKSIGDTYGRGDKLNTFNLPNIKSNISAEVIEERMVTISDKDTDVQTQDDSTIDTSEAESNISNDGNAADSENIEESTIKQELITTVKNIEMTAYIKY